MTTQEQRLIQGDPETMMALLNVSVFVRLPRLDPLAEQAIVVQQPLLASSEGLGAVAAGQRVERGGKRVRAMPLRGAAQLPQRGL